jgi:hypothetical protein
MKGVNLSFGGIDTFTYGTRYSYNANFKSPENQPKLQHLHSESGTEQQEERVIFCCDVKFLLSNL